MRSSMILAAAAALLTLTVVVKPAAQGGGPPPQGRNAPPPFPAQMRPPGDPALIAVVTGLYGVHCRVCHGADLRGGDQGGPNLLRSDTVLNDRAGELITPVVVNGQGAMPPIRVTPEDARAITEYIHSVAAKMARQGGSSAGCRRGAQRAGRRCGRWRGLLQGAVWHVPFADGRSASDRFANDGSHHVAELLDLSRRRAGARRPWRTQPADAGDRHAGHRGKSRRHAGASRRLLRRRRACLTAASAPSVAMETSRSWRCVIRWSLTSRCSRASPIDDIHNVTAYLVTLK